MTTDASRLYQLAVRNAQQQWGSGWQHLGTRFQRALVAEEVLRVAAGQDEIVPAERVRDVVTTGFASLPRP